MQTPCIGQYFNDLSQIGYSQIAIPIEYQEGSVRMSFDRPSLPFLGYDSDVIMFDAGAQTEGEDCLKALMNDVYVASVSKVNGVSSGVQYASGDYGEYLYKLIFGKTGPELRYQSQAEFIRERLGNIDAITRQQLEEQQEKFFQFCKDCFDKKLFIPPGEYIFPDTSQFYIELEAWNTDIADQVAYIRCLEIVSI